MARLREFHLCVLNGCYMRESRNLSDIIGICFSREMQKRMQEQDMMSSLSYRLKFDERLLIRFQPKYRTHRFNEIQCTRIEMLQKID